MGRVWRAADEMLDRPVAVKEMRIDGLDAEDTRTRRERTLREARATARIDHPNVVRVYDVVDEGERLWIVMELIAGRSLERIMVDDGPLGPRETARIGLGLVAALRQVHARGVLHRDIKPGNVLVEGDGERIVLTDFGIAAIQDAKALTMVGMLVGSPDYMAPERISGRPQGPPSDIWSLGATLCAALGGRSPFSRDTTLATLHAVLYEEPELPAAAGPLRDVLAALLEKDPSVRPGLEDLEEALRPVAFPAPEPTLPVGGADPGRPTREEEPPAEAAAGSGAGPAAEPEPEPEGRAQDGQAAPPESEPPGESATPGGTPPAPWVPNETATPAYLDTRLVRAARDPRQPEPEPVQDAIPQELPDTHDLRRDRAAARSGTGDAFDNHTTAHEAPADSSATEPPAPETPQAQPAEPFVHAEAPNASTEVPSELRSEVRSETPSAANSAPPAAHSAPPGPRPSGVSFVREHPLVEQPAGQENGSGFATGLHPASRQGAQPGPRQGPPSTAEQATRPALGPHPLRTPRGEPPGPAVPATPRRSRRRTGLVAAAGLVGAGAVVAVVLLTNSGSPGDDKAGSTTSPTTSRPPTVEGTSRPPSLPPGTHQEAGGFAWATPKGWQRNVKTGAEVHYTSPDGAQEIVAKSSVARGDLVKTWEQSERNARQGQDYQKIRFEQTTFRGNPAVVWEYTVTVNGVPWHARLLGFNQDGRSYQINIWYQPDVETAAVKTYNKVKDSFIVL
ncbi:protein kinase [Streptomyces sp. NPDC047043]|uniref:serine/threonine-protein kinase n=1 Tax=Streptomyces sp. NPDC047043 TaxID=3154497 RepID=UPI0033D5DFCF